MSTNLGLARDYNVFIFGDISLSNTDAEGRVASGGNVTLRNYGIGAGITPLPPAGTDLSFVADGNIDVSGGSNARGSTVVNPASAVVNYTMGNPNGSLTTGTPVDFTEAERYLKCASSFWNALEPNGTGEIASGQLNLTGTDEILNIFSFDAAALYGTGISLSQLNGIDIIAPVDSTVLINVRGAAIQYGSYQIFRNGNAASRENAKKILWNFPEALTWTNSTTAIYGSVLAPFAAAVTTYSQINGNIIFDSYTGNAESHNELFNGELPEPAACLLPDTAATESDASSSTTAASSAREQAVSDLVESVALQQTALSHILNAEGKKLQKILSFDDITPDTILLANKSVESMVNSVSEMEMVLKMKLDLFKGCR